MVRWRAWCVGLAAAALAGCGGGLRLGEVSGRVTVGGRPVPDGVVMFHPDAGPAAVGSLQPDGTYTLQTGTIGPGAVVGRHRVTIEATRVGPGSIVEARSLDEETSPARATGKALVPGKVTWVVPESYSRPESSGLAVDVRDGPNTHDFDIPAP